MMEYQERLPIDQEKAEEILQMDDVDSICPILVSIGMHEENWQWAQEILLTFLEHKNAEVRRVAAISLGHFARVHKKLDKKRVETALEKYLGDPEMYGQAEETLSDIEHYLALERILDRKTAEEMLNSGDTENICDALLSLAYHDQDWKYVQETALSFLEHPDPKVRRVAADGLAQVAGEHYCLDKDKVISALEKHINDPIIGDKIKQSIEDIEIFMAPNEE